jgi:hypothetical protein
VNNEIEWTWNKATVVLSVVVPQNRSGRNEENCEKPQSGKTVRGNLQIWGMGSSHLVVMFGA